MSDSGRTRPETDAWDGLLRTHAMLVRDVDRELRAAQGLPLAWYEALRHVVETPRGRMRMGELAERMVMTRAGVSGLVDRLERAKLIQRERVENDARGLYAAITPGGRRLLERAASTHSDIVRRRYTSRLDAAELALVGRVWERVASDTRPD